MTEPPTFEQLLDKLCSLQRWRTAYLSRPTGDEKRYQSVVAEFADVREALREYVAELEAEIVEARQILADGVDRDKDPKDTLRGLAVVAVNGIYWRDKSLAHLQENALTPEEAKALYDHGPRADRITHAFTDAAAFKSGWAKLRALSASEEPK